MGACTTVVCAALAALRVHHVLDALTVHRNTCTPLHCNPRHQLSHSRHRQLLHVSHSALALFYHRVTLASTRLLSPSRVIFEFYPRLTRQRS